jgi:hypothetical protein
MGAAYAAGSIDGKREPLPLEITATRIASSKAALT